MSRYTPSSFEGVGTILQAADEKCWARAASETSMKELDACLRVGVLA